MWWPIIGIGGSYCVSCTYTQTGLKSYEVWKGDQRASIPESLKEALVGEEARSKRLRKYPEILQRFCLQKIHPGIHALFPDFHVKIGDFGGSVRYSSL